MPIDEVHTKELRTLIAASRQQPVNFGLCLGAKPETDTLLLHRTKAPRALSMEAKAQAKGTKAAFGTAAAEGTTLSLACEEKPPSGIAKRARLMLKASKLPLKVRLVGADGEVFEEDGEEEAPAPRGGEAAAAASPEAAKSPETTPPSAALTKPVADVAPDTAAFAKLLATLAARIPAAAGTDEARRAILLKLAGQANVYLKTNNPSDAADVIERLRGEIEGGSPTPPMLPAVPPPMSDAAALAKQLAILIPLIGGVTDAVRKAELGKLAQTCNLYLKTNNFATATSSIAQLTHELDGLTPAPGAPPKDAATYEEASKAWLTVRQDVKDSLEQLRATIVATYEGQPIASQIDQAFRTRTAPVMSTLDASLAQKLAKAAKTDAAARPQLMGEVRSILRTYEKFVDDPLLADLDDNPFVALSIRQALNAAFRSLDATIS